MSEEVVREQHGSVLLVRINRPEARNALNDAVCQGVGQAVLDAESDAGIRAMVLTGTGDKSFCAGVDLKEMAAGIQWTPGPPQQALLRLMDGDVALPVVGGANASALGGGLELLLGCDLIVASAAAQFGLPEVKRGLFPGGSGTAVVQRVPLGVGLEMLLTGEPISAERAYDVHLVNAVVAPDEVVPAALALAERVAANAPLGIAAVRELGRLYATDAAKADERRTHWRGLVFGSEDAAEGATAFAEKRTPVWRGR